MRPRIGIGCGILIEIVVHWSNWVVDDHRKSERNDGASQKEALVGRRGGRGPRRSFRVVLRFGLRKFLEGRFDPFGRSRSRGTDHRTSDFVGKPLGHLSPRDRDDQPALTHYASKAALCSEVAPISSEVGFGSNCETLDPSNSGPLTTPEQTSKRGHATSQMEVADHALLIRPTRYISSRSTCHWPLNENERYPDANIGTSRPSQQTET